MQTKSQIFTSLIQSLICDSGSLKYSFSNFNSFSFQKGSTVASPFITHTKDTNQEKAQQQQAIEQELPNPTPRYKSMISNQNQPKQTELSLKQQASSEISSVTTCGVGSSNNQDDEGDHGWCKQGLEQHAGKHQQLLQLLNSFRRI